MVRCSSSRRSLNRPKLPRRSGGVPRFRPLRVTRNRPAAPASDSAAQELPPAAVVVAPTVSTQPAVQPRAIRNKKPAKVRRNRVKGEIRKCQAVTTNIIPRHSFEKLVRKMFAEIAGRQVSLAKDAVDALQTEAENVLTNLFIHTNLIAENSQRMTIMSRDLYLARRFLHL